MTRVARYLALAALLVGAVTLAVVVWRDEDDSRATVRTAQDEPAATSTVTERTTTAPPRPAPATTAATSTLTERTTTAAPRPAPAPAAYELAPTRSCLLTAGFAVSTVRTKDPRLRALGDLAQKSSFELRSGGHTVGLAFGDTRLLLSLLRVPNDPYRLETRRNALLMYRPSARDEAAVVRGCLRP